MLPPPREQAAAGVPAASEIGLLIAGLPGVADRLIADHTADATGRCRGCALPQRGQVHWPCTLLVYAREARRMQDASRFPRLARRRGR